MVSPAFSVPRNKQQSGGALIAKREEWMGAPSQDKTPERACGIIAWNSPAQPPLSSSQSDCKTALDAGPYGVLILECKSSILCKTT
jgi:hypothetical protein